MEKYTLVGIDGNCFCVMGYVCQCMRREHKKQWEIDNYLAAAKASDYDNLLRVSVEMIEDLNAPYADLPDPNEENMVQIPKDEFAKLLAMIGDMQAQIVQNKLENNPNSIENLPNFQSMEAWQKIDEIVEFKGPQFVVDELKQWMPTDQLNKFANGLAIVSDYSFSDERSEEEE